MTSIRNGKLKNINKFNTGTFEKNVKYSFSSKSFKNILDLNAPTWTKLLLDYSIFFQRGPI